MSNTKSTPPVATALRNWFEAFPVDDVRARVEELERQRAQIDRELTFLQEGLEQYAGFLAVQDSGQARLPLRDAPIEDSPPPTRRQAVLDFMSGSPGRPFKLAEIRYALIRQGLLPSTESAAAALQMLVSNMVKKHQLERPTKGYYVLPAEAGADTEAPASNGVQT
jgi:hypothetical protein